MAAVVGYIQVTQGKGTKMRATKEDGVWIPHHIIDNVGSESAFYTDTIEPVQDIPIQLTSVSTPIKQVFVKAANDNAAYIYVITKNTDNTTDGYELGNGESIPIVIDDLSKVWILCPANSQLVSYIGS